MKKLLLLAISLLLISCGTTKIIEKPVEVEKIHTEYVYQKLIDTILVHDSIYSKDSIYIEKKGDTVFYNKIQIKYIERNNNISSNKIDSTTIKDTIPNIITITETITKKEKVNVLYWWLKALMWTGGICWLGIITFFVLKISKRI